MEDKGNDGGGGDQWLCGSKIWQDIWIILKANNQEMQPVEDSAAKSYKSKEESYEDSWDCKEESSENAKEPALVDHSAILSLNCFLFMFTGWLCTINRLIISEV